MPKPNPIKIIICVISIPTKPKEIGSTYLFINYFLQKFLEYKWNEYHRLILIFNDKKKPLTLLTVNRTGLGVVAIFKKRQPTTEVHYLFKY